MASNINVPTNTIVQQVPLFPKFRDVLDMPRIHNLKFTRLIWNKDIIYDTHKRTYYIDGDTYPKKAPQVKKYYDVMMGRLLDKEVYEYQIFTVKVAKKVEMIALMIDGEY